MDRRGDFTSHERLTGDSCWRKNRYTARMTPLRKKIIAMARKFDGAIMTEFQVMDLRGTIGSMDDTLTDDEVLMFLEHLASGREYDMLISGQKPSKKLVKVHVDKDLKGSVSPAPFSKS